MRPRSVLSACEYRPAIAATNSSRAAMLIRLIPDPADEHRPGARGELRVALPAGLACGRDGRIGVSRDEEVPARLLHLFVKFRELRSAKAVMRHFQEANFLVPVRPLDGPSPHDVVWRPASNARILQVLKNPASAGAHVYGRRRRTPIGRRSGSRQGATEAVAVQDWPVCLKDAFP